MGLFDYMLPDIDDLDNHHPPCRGGCGQLADECMCNWNRKYYGDVRGEGYGKSEQANS
jgi:hypothetical protein